MCCRCSLIAWPTQSSNRRLLVCHFYRKWCICRCYFYRKCILYSVRRLLRVLLFALLNQPTAPVALRHCLHCIGIINHCVPAACASSAFCGSQFSLSHFNDDCEGDTCAIELQLVLCVSELVQNVQQHSLIVMGTVIHECHGDSHHSLCHPCSNW